MRILFTATANAYVHETWIAEIPDDTPESEWRDALDERLTAGECQFVADKVDGEHDREIASITGPVR
jgi:hypothetical protein